MSEEGTYGAKMAALSRLQHAPSLVMRSLRNATIAITEMKSDNPSREISLPTSFEDSFIASVSLKDDFLRESWLDGKPTAPQSALPAGIVTLLDLRRANQIRFLSPIHSVQFYFSRNALKTIAEKEGLNPAIELATQASLATIDTTFHRLALALLPALRNPEDVSRLFIDHITLAAAAHLLREHGTQELPVLRFTGGLAPWQQKRALELLDSDFDGELSIDMIAAECRLSPRHFSRAFNQSFGVPPHRWQLERRVEKAQVLLLQSNLSLVEIAEAAGFTSQSHLTRIFSKLIGASPGAWRREQRR